MSEELRTHENEDQQKAIPSHHSLYLSQSKDKAQKAIFYSYAKHINGFAAVLGEEEAMQISNDPLVLSVFRNEMLQLYTTRSWGMMELERDGRVPPMSIWTKAKFGEDVIIGSLDTGVWPESQSFSDGGIGPVPSRWKGSCQNNTKEGVLCNRKLIGAKYFNKGLEAEMGSSAVRDAVSARDADGHGTHTLSTAGGRFVPGANILGYANGTAKGGAPSARVAVYKICWFSGCYVADVLAGFDEAIHDGVDVLSVSMGFSVTRYFRDPVAIGAFHAVMEGITVVCAAGNQGPRSESVSNAAPWLITVAASTIDRNFPAILTLGNKKQIEGQSLSTTGSLPENKFYPLIYGKDAMAANVSNQFTAQICQFGSLDPMKIQGKLVICQHDIMTNDKENGWGILKAGGIGMVLVNTQGTNQSLIADPHLLPATFISPADASILRSYFDSTKEPVGHISSPRTQNDLKPAPVMADFSSRGPNILTPQILKPDITAPGVSILAAFTQATSPTGFTNDTRRFQFATMSGTSMSCPHVSGVVALLKNLYPNWSPSAIKSAIMTTGHLRPNKAMDPGLVYDLTIDDHLKVLCSLGYNSSMIATFYKKAFSCPTEPMKIEDLNYPSIAAPNVTTSITVIRTLKNVGTPGVYKVEVEAPKNISVSVKPDVLEFQKVGDERTFEVSLNVENGTVGEGYRFGRLVWSDGTHFVRSPIAVNVLP
ncbi:hypothetical protein J5N97_008083 [Dioscorea zingiberensis]|uniref:Subtilisin-like protease SBT5.3 n=1 Tax=Dioscorea zingiberensis TaxID=325984 RepID=A0A9D5DH69_9LILI|nr:hypothetical protein J5N97_008083 [Dioscorea zingiberensis]